MAKMSASCPAERDFVRAARAAHLRLRGDEDGAPTSTPRGKRGRQVKLQAHSEGILALSLRAHSARALTGLAKRLPPKAALCWQDGDTEATYLLPAGRLGEVADIYGLRKAGYAGTSGS